MYADAARRAAHGAHAATLGVDVLLLSVGPDLPYLTGYEAMPLERLTMLVVPRDGDAVLVVPRLEAPRVVEHPEVFRLEPWDETDDPIARRRRARRAAAPRRVARSATRPGPASSLALQDALPDVALPAGDRRHRPAAHREGRGRDRRAACRRRTRSTTSPA